MNPKLSHQNRLLQMRSVLDYICQDLLVLILKRLPVKTLFRCQCVCKPWKQFIASKSFVLDHLPFQRPRLIAQNKSHDYLILDPRSLPFSDTLTCLDRFQMEKQRLVVVACVHGVIFLYNNANLLFLWNPSIRQYSRIPLCYSWIRHPEKADFMYCGFWIHPSNGDFKVVMFNIRDPKRCSLFSSTKGKRKWMKVLVDTGDIGDNYRPDVESLQVLVDGVAHWAAYVDAQMRAKVILFFDFGKDKFGTIELPELVRLTDSSVNVCKWQDSLSIVEWQVVSPYGCDLWAMRNGSWSKMFSYNLTSVVTEVYCVLGDWGRVLASTKSGITKEELFYDPIDGCIPLKSKLVVGLGNISVAYDFVEGFVFPYRKLYRVVKYNRS